MNHKLIKKKSNQIYDAAFKKHGDDIKSVLWNDQDKQYFRFSELIKNINLELKDKTILDLGCGSCGLYKYLSDLGYKGKYTGYDINASLINLAKKKFPKINIKLIDIIEDDPQEKFNYVLVSGVLNANAGQNIAWVKKILIKSFDLTKEILSFNALSTHVNHIEKEMFYIDPSEILSFCIKNLSKRVSLYHHNLPFNYTVSVFKDPIS